MKYIILILISLLIFSCENEVDGDLPFEEQIVISSILTANVQLTSDGFSNISFVHIGKTIYPLDEPDSNNSFVKNAQVTISDNGKIYDLRYAKSGFWVSDEFTPSEGHTYNIEVQYNNKTAKATTFIPVNKVEVVDLNPEIVKSKRFDGSYYYLYNIRKQIKVNQNTFALLFSDISTTDDNKPIKSIRSDYLYTNSNSSNDFKYTAISFSMDNLGDTALFNYKILYYIDLYDPAVEQYWKTRYEGEENSGIFSSGGLNRKGNIKNGIGFFYGCSSKLDSVIVD